MQIHFRSSSSFYLCFSQANPSSVLEYSFYLDDQHGTVMGPVSPPDTTMIQRPCPFIPLPSPVTTIATAIDLNPAVSSPMTDSCSPICSMCNPTASDRDTLRSTSTSPGCSDRDPVCAAAHLHLLGESLSLIGHHLQQTDVSEHIECWSVLLYTIRGCTFIMEEPHWIIQIMMNSAHCTRHRAPSHLNEH